MRALYTSDLHGDTGLYRQLFARIEESRPDVVILGGDICPTRFGPDGPPIQRKFLIELLRRFDRAFEAHGTRFFYIFGNADCRANWDWLLTEERPHAVPIHDRVVPLANGLSIAGYSYVPVTPLALKDWEKRDSRETGAERWEGIVSGARGMKKVDLREDAAGSDLASDLAGLAAKIGDAPTICVLHSPPSDTQLDCIEPGRHVGSLAVRDFILSARPRLALHGHIHESPRVTGRYAELLGGCLCVNPGQALKGELHAVLFDPEDMQNSMRHTIFGAAATG